MVSFLLFILLWLMSFIGYEETLCSALAIQYSSYLIWLLQAVLI